MDLTEHKPGPKHTAADLIFDEQFKKQGEAAGEMRRGFPFV
jgi:hypothetical protein